MKNYKITVKKKEIEITFILQTIVMLISGIFILRSAADRFSWFTCIGGLLVTATGLFNGALIAEYVCSPVNYLPDTFEWTVKIEEEVNDDEESSEL